MTTGQQGKKLICKGITAKIDPQNDSDIQYDDDNRFYTINHQLADEIIAQDVTNIPVLVQHSNKYKIGGVTCFYKERVNNQDVLSAEFVITSQSFLNALSKQATIRYLDLIQIPFVSPDNFIVTPSQTAENNIESITVDSQLVLTQKFAGLSLQHDLNNLSVTELSICLAGARELSVITDVQYKPGDIIFDTDTNTEEDYLTLLSSALSYSNCSAAHKVASDLAQVGGDPKRTNCLIYNYMHKIPQVKDKSIKTMESVEMASQDLMKSILQEMKKSLSSIQTDDDTMSKAAKYNQKSVRHKRQRDNDEYIDDFDGDCRTSRYQSHPHKKFKSCCDDYHHCYEQDIKYSCYRPHNNHQYSTTTLQPSHHYHIPHKVDDASQLPLHPHYSHLINKAVDVTSELSTRDKNSQVQHVMQSQGFSGNSPIIIVQPCTGAHKNGLTTSVLDEDGIGMDNERNGDQQNDYSSQKNKDSLTASAPNIKSPLGSADHSYSLRSKQLKRSNALDFMKKAEEDMCIE